MVFKLPRLKKTEVLLAHVVWWLNFTYLLIVTGIEVQSYKKRLTGLGHLKPGWLTKLFNVFGVEKIQRFHQRDRRDGEWEQFIKAGPLLFLVVPFVYTSFYHLFRLLHFRKTIQRGILFILSVGILTWLLTWQGMLIISSLTVVFYALGRLRERFIIYVAAFLFVTLINDYEWVFTQFLDPELPKRWTYFLVFSISTQVFRLISMSLFIAAQEDNPDSLFDALEYNFFLPVFCGPWFIYSFYRKDRDNRMFMTSFVDLFKQFIGLGILFVFIEFYIHVIPFSSFAYDPRSRKDISLVGVTGVAMYAVQHFCLKYMVMYGIGSFWSHLCGIRTPGGPHQVSTRCTFRDMWREFDKGLHLFLKHCIYLPICTSRATWRVIVGTVASFFTVYYWHGATETCRDWATANCVGVMLEFLIYRAYQTRFVQSLPSSITGRFNILLQSVLFGWLILSNLIYLFQSDAAFQIINRIYFESTRYTFYLHFVLYSGVISISSIWSKNIQIEPN